MRLVFFPHFIIAAKKLCTVLWPSGRENVNHFYYFWFGPIITLNLIYKVEPHSLSRHLYIVIIHLYLFTYTRVCPIMSLECYIKALTSCIPLSWSSIVFHLNLASTWIYDKIENNCPLSISFKVLADKDGQWVKKHWQ